MSFAQIPQPEVKAATTYVDTLNEVIQQTNDRATLGDALLEALQETDLEVSAARSYMLDTPASRIIIDHVAPGFFSMHTRLKKSFQKLIEELEHNQIHKKDVVYLSRDALLQDRKFYFRRNLLFETAATITQPEQGIEQLIKHIIAEEEPSQHIHKLRQWGENSASRATKRRVKKAIQQEIVRKGRTRDVRAYVISAEFKAGDLHRIAKDMLDKKTNDRTRINRTTQTTFDFTLDEAIQFYQDIISEGTTNMQKGEPFADPRIRERENQKFYLEHHSGPQILRDSVRAYAIRDAAYDILAKQTEAAKQKEREIGAYLTAQGFTLAAKFHEKYNSNRSITKPDFIQQAPQEKESIRTSIRSMAVLGALVQQPDEATIASAIKRDHPHIHNEWKPKPVAAKDEHKARNLELAEAFRELMRRPTLRIVTKFSLQFLLQDKDHQKRGEASFIESKIEGISGDPSPYVLQDPYFYLDQTASKKRLNELLHPAALLDVYLSAAQFFYQIVMPMQEETGYADVREKYTAFYPHHQTNFLRALRKGGRQTVVNDMQYKAQKNGSGVKVKNLRSKIAYLYGITPTRITSNKIHYEIYQGENRSPLELNFERRAIQKLPYRHTPTVLTYLLRCQFKTAKLLEDRPRMVIV